MRGAAASQRAAVAAPQQPRAAAQQHPAVLAHCTVATAPSGARCDAAVQTDPAESASADAHDTWARLAAVVAQDPRVVQSLQASFRGACAAQLAAATLALTLRDVRAPCRARRVARLG